MTRPQLVREIYFELRRSMMGRATPQEMLDSAPALDIAGRENSLPHACKPRN